MSIVVELGPILRTDSGHGVAWALAAEDRDLDANLVTLGPGDQIAEHVNDELDVVLVVLQGSGHVVLDGDTHPVTASTLVHVDAGRRRAIRAGHDGFGYVSVHRRRHGLSVGSGRPAHGSPTA